MAKLARRSSRFKRRAPAAPRCDDRSITTVEHPWSAGFVDRTHAGRALAQPLAEALRGLKAGAARIASGNGERAPAPTGASAPVVLGLARGGVVVGFEVASALGLELDVLVARKVGAPHNPELGIAAIVESGTVVRSEELLRELAIGEWELQRRIALAEEQLRERVAIYRSGKPLAVLDGKVAVIVDDGLATGNTALAAIVAARAGGASRVVCAVPVGAPSTVAELRREADAVLCLLEPEPMRAIGVWYEDFSQVSDEQVLELLDQARRRFK